jgi:hypothetical protein
MQQGYEDWPADAGDQSAFWREHSTAGDHAVEPGFLKFDRHGRMVLLWRLNLARDVSLRTCKGRRLCIIAD